MSGTAAAGASPRCRGSASSVAPQGLQSARRGPNPHALASEASAARASPSDWPAAPPTRQVRPPHPPHPRGRWSRRSPRRAQIGGLFDRRPPSATERRSRRRRRGRRKRRAAAPSGADNDGLIAKVRRLPRSRPARPRRTRRRRRCRCAATVPRGVRGGAVDLVSHGEWAGAKPGRWLAAHTSAVLVSSADSSGGAAPWLPPPLVLVPLAPLAAVASSASVPSCCSFHRRSVADGTVASSCCRAVSVGCGLEGAAAWRWRPTARRARPRRAGGGGGGGRIRPPGYLLALLFGLIPPSCSSAPAAPRRDGLADDRRPPLPALPRPRARSVRPLVAKRQRAPVAPTQVVHHHPAYRHLLRRLLLLLRLLLAVVLRLELTVLGSAVGRDAVSKALVPVAGDSLVATARRGRRRRRGAARIAERLRAVGDAERVNELPTAAADGRPTPPRARADGGRRRRRARSSRAAGGRPTRSRAPRGVSPSLRATTAAAARAARRPAVVAAAIAGAEHPVAIVVALQHPPQHAQRRRLRRLGRRTGSASASASAVGSDGGAACLSTRRRFGRGSSAPSAAAPAAGEPRGAGRGAAGGGAGGGGGARAGRAPSGCCAAAPGAHRARQARVVDLELRVLEPALERRAVELLDAEVLVVLPQAEICGRERERRADCVWLVPRSRIAASTRDESSACGNFAESAPSGPRYERCWASLDAAAASLARCRRYSRGALCGSRALAPDLELSPKRTPPHAADAAPRPRPRRRRRRRRTAARAPPPPPHYSTPQI